MKVLVTGGAGYIGSFMSRRLLDAGFDVVVADHIERGHLEAVDNRSILEKGDLLDESFLNRLFTSHNFDAIIHFAGFISMGESMENPEMYFKNNTFATLKLLEQAAHNKVNKFIFSSTAGVYGNPFEIPIPENHPKNPENPYGESKLMVERILSWFQKIHGVNFVSLRYFNACGAALDGSLGEDHDPESHIIPNAIKAALHNEPFKLFGTDYKTPDGTCVRDYIHVIDLVEAHVLALNKLNTDAGGFIYNVGTGRGYSNREVLEMVRKVSGIDFKIDEVQRRPGDADTLVASTEKIRTELGFDPKYSDLETIIKTAFSYHKQFIK